MSRLVQAAQIETVSRGPGRGGLESAGGQVKIPVGGDDYADRLAKYIPGEILAAYLSLDRNLVSNAADLAREQKAGHLSEALTKMAEQDSLAPFMYHLPLGIFLLGLAATPLYFWQLSRSAGGKAPWTTHAFIATLAFIVWAYAIQGSYFVISDWYNGKIASALVVVFTLFSGIFRPDPDDGQAANAPARGANL